MLIKTRITLFHRPKVLVGFLSELTGVTSPNGGRKTYSLCLAIEHIYSVRNLNFIGPYSFSPGLVKWAFSGSKTTHSLDGTTSASGSVITLRAWMKESAKNPNVIYDSGGIDIFADNTQRKGKTSRVKEDGTTPIGKVHFFY